jgi:hypothetical protein
MAAAIVAMQQHGSISAAAIVEILYSSNTATAAV